MANAATLDAPVVDEPIIAEPVVVPKQRDEQRTKTKKQPPYAVILHNDDVHTFPYVIELLQKVFGYPRIKAVWYTTQVHFSGRSAVWSGSLEVAELKRDQVRGYGPDHFGPKPVTFPLGVTVEPLPGE